MIASPFGLALDVPVDLFDFLLVFNGSGDMAPALLSLKKPIVGGIVVGFDDMGDTPFLEYGFNQLGLELIPEDHNLVVIAHAYILPGIVTCQVARDKPMSLL
jgi:hypothetical protein